MRTSSQARWEEKDVLTVVRFAQRLNGATTRRARDPQSLLWGNPLCKASRGNSPHHPRPPSHRHYHHLHRHHDDDDDHHCSGQGSCSTTTSTTVTGTLTSTTHGFVLDRIFKMIKWNRTRLKMEINLHLIFCTSALNNLSKATGTQRNPTSVPLW